MQPAFPSEVKSAMRTCILEIIWPRKEIVKLLGDHGCTPAELNRFANYEGMGLSRKGIVDSAFEGWSARQDGGLGPFRALLKTLCDWSTFDPYFFDELRKLDKSKATQALERLRKLQEDRDGKILHQRQVREEREKQAAKAVFSLDELKQKFLDLHSGRTRPQRRGYALEEILIELARNSLLEVTEPFRIVGEQIDGAVKHEGEHYLLEAKWQSQPASTEPLYKFAHQTEGKMYGRGFFISVHGFEPSVVSALISGKATKTMLVDGGDLVLVLEGHLTFAQMLNAKIRAAQTKAIIYVHPITGANKAFSA